MKGAGHNTSKPALRFLLTRRKSQDSWRVVAWMIFEDCGGHTHHLWEDEDYGPSYFLAGGAIGTGVVETWVISMLGVSSNRSATSSWTDTAGSDA